MRRWICFITNSSSTNIVIALPKDKLPIIRVTLDIDLTEFGDVVTITEHNIDHVIEDRFIYEEELIEKMRNSIREGKIIYYINFSNHSNEYIERILTNKGLIGPNVEFINETQVLCYIPNT